jgi:hypothetical protein
MQYTLTKFILSIKFPKEGDNFDETTTYRI